MKTTFEVKNMFFEKSRILLDMEELYQSTNFMFSSTNEIPKLFLKSSFTSAPILSRATVISKVEQIAKQEILTKKSRIEQLRVIRRKD